MPGVAPTHKPTQSTKGRQNFHEQAMVNLASSRARAHESHEFDIPAGADDFSLKNDLDHVADCSCGRGAFTRIEWAHRVIIRQRGTATVSVKFVTDPDVVTDPDLATIEDGENFNFDLLEVHDLLFTNDDGSVQRVKVILA